VNLPMRVYERQVGSEVRQEKIQIPQIASEPFKMGKMALSHKIAIPMRTDLPWAKTCFSKENGPQP
jgi:hypothetical protein